jgi:hypothetical protein
MPSNKKMPFAEPKAKKFTKSFVIGLIITFVIAAMFSISIYYYEIGTLGLDVESDLFNILSDTFSIPGLIFVLSYCMVFAARSGVFDMFNYAVGLAWTNVFHKNIRESKFASSYGEYKELKRAKESSDTSYILYVGTIFLLVGVVFLILFYSSI